MVMGLLLSPFASNLKANKVEINQPQQNLNLVRNNGPKFESKLKENMFVLDTTNENKKFIRTIKPVKFEGAMQGSHSTTLAFKTDEELNIRGGLESADANECNDWTGGGYGNCKSANGWRYFTISLGQNTFGPYYGFEFDKEPQEKITQVMMYDGADVPEDAFYSADDISGPHISGASATYVSNVDNPITAEYLKSLLIAIDETDGDLTDQIQIDFDTFTGHEDEVGEYEIVFSVSDKAGNKSTFTMKILVQDKTAPVITGPATIELSYTEATTAEALKSRFSVSDNVDSDLTLAIESDTYTASSSVPGKYRIIYSATDKSNNKGTKTVDVTVKDDVAPIITGADKVEKSLSSILSIDEIVEEYSANDAIDGNVEIVIEEDGYTGHGNKVGNYNVTLTATDKSGNKATKKIVVSVFDDIKPLWYVKMNSNITIYVDRSIKLTEVDVKRILARENFYNPSETTVFKLTDNDNYFAQENPKPGEYDLGYSIKSVSGETKDVVVTLNVQDVDEKEQVDTPKTEKVKNWFQKAFDFKNQSWGAIVVECICLVGIIALVICLIRRFRR